MSFRPTYRRQYFAHCCRKLPNTGALDVGTVGARGATVVNINVTGNRLIRSGPVFRATLAPCIDRTASATETGVGALDEPFGGL